MDRTKSRGAMWGLLALVVTIGLMGTALAGGSALAARGGNRAATGSYAVSVSPNLAPYGTNTFVISGTGYKANSVVSVGVGGMLCCGMVPTDSSGSFSYTWNRTLMPGTYSVGVARLRGSSWVPAASTTFTVTP